MSLLSLEGDCGMDKVPRCRLLTPFQEGPHNKLFSHKVFKQGGNWNYSTYSEVSLLITGKLLASHFYRMAIAKDH